MREKLLDILACPMCKNHPLELINIKSKDEEIQDLKKAKYEDKLINTLLQKEVEEQAEKLMALHGTNEFVKPQT